MASTERGQPGTWEYLAWWSGPETMDTRRTLAELPASDYDSALMMKASWPDEMAYVPGDQLWYCWTGAHLPPDEDSQVRKRINIYADLLRAMLVHLRQQLAAETAIAMAGHPQAEIDKRAADEWAAIEKNHGGVRYARGLRGQQKANALLGALSTVCSASPEDMADRWPEHVNTADGVLALAPREGEPELHGHHPAWRMSYLVSAGWKPDADCPEFRGLLFRACGGDEPVYWYLVKALGYALLGANPHRLIFFLSGPTSNGKSTLLEIVCSVLGPQLSYEAKPDLIGKTRYARHARHEATMRGKRLITISETNEQLDIDEMQVKRLTGERHLQFETLYAKTMTRTTVTWVIFVANNEMPSILHLDAAMRHRVVVIPMGPEIPPHLRDAALAGRICENERDGILQLLAWGCRQAMAGDLLAQPAAVAAKTRAYAEEQNIASLWVAERCTWNGQSPQQAGADCYRSMEQWIERGKAKPSRQQFYAQLGEVPGVTRHGDVNHAMFSGIEVKQDWA